MMPLLQEISLTENESFVVRRIYTPCFEERLHRHVEHELILFTNGQGDACMGNKMIPFDTGAVFFIDSQLPHMFTGKDKEPVGALMIQFREDCWGLPFLQMPESRSIRQLLQTAGLGLQLTGHCQYKVQSLIYSLEKATQVNRVILLLQCLQEIENTDNFIIISTQHLRAFNDNHDDSIDKVLQFTRACFFQPVSLAQVAAVACMSVSSFCQYFKRTMHKTYFHFLNEMRVHYACRQLRETGKPIIDIGFESGYNTVSHFHRQFLKLKKTTPLQYRKIYASSFPVNEQGVLEAY